MFDIGFSELVLVFIVGLVVLGPQRLPIAIRTVMGWIRTIRGLAANVQNELSQELKLQELQESIKKAEALNLSKLSPELSKTVEELKQSAEKMQANLNANVQKVQSLTDEQVAEIQAKIEQESQQLHPTSDTSESIPQGISPDELAEQAELDESKLSAYYPPDDELANVMSEPKQDKK